MQDNLSGGCKRVAAAILNFFKLSISDHREEKERPKWQHPLGCFISCMVRRELELQKWRHAQVGASGGNHRRHAPSPLDAHFSWMPHFSGCHPPCGSQSSQQQERRHRGHCPASWFLGGVMQGFPRILQRTGRQERRHSSPFSGRPAGAASMGAPVNLEPNPMQVYSSDVLMEVLG